MVCFTAMVLITALPIILMGALILLPMVWLVLFQNITRGYLRPFMGQYLNDHLESEHRATVSSVQSAVDALAQFALLGFFGLILKAVNLPVALIMLGLGTLFAGLYLLVQYQKIFKPSAG